MAFAPQLCFDAVSEIHRISNEAAQNGPHSWLCHGLKFRREEPTCAQSSAAAPASSGAEPGRVKKLSSWPWRIHGEDSGRSRQTLARWGGPELGARRISIERTEGSVFRRAGLCSTVSKCPGRRNDR